ncbi:MAG: hypothetical protein P1U56_19000 [Saprospiraceae bacterium]|nr:hypothetical protein [Saprospiraceae bacterium]
MNNDYLRHTLATIDYRFQKSVKYSTFDFGNFSLGNGSRSPTEIIHHMFDVLHSTTLFIQEGQKQKVSHQKLNLNEEIDRFLLEIKQLDNVLTEQELDMNYSKRLLQGPLSDILTHIGQISMLSRLNNHPIEREDFSSANIRTESSE